MIPSKHWFPGTLPARALWYQNFATQILAIGVGTLSLPVADVTAVSNDNEDFQSIADTTVAVENFAAAVRAYRITLTEGNTGDPQPVFPSENFSGPPNDRPAGMFERLDNLVKRIRLNPAYTPEIGEALGIVPTTPAPPLFEDLKPVIKASESSGGYAFNVNVTRMGMTAFKVQVQRTGEVGYKDAVFATNNPAEVTIVPTTPDQPERILVRAVLLKDNEPVGVPSDPTYVTVNP